MSGITVEAVRVVLADLAKKGFSVEVKSLLGKYSSAGKLSEVKPEHYGALWSEARELLNRGGKVVMNTTATGSWEKKDFTAEDVTDITKTLAWNGRANEIKQLRQKYPSNDPINWSQLQRNDFVLAAKAIGADYTEYYAGLKAYTEAHYNLIFQKTGLEWATVDMLGILLDPHSSAGRFPGKTQESYFPCPRLVFPGDKSSFSTYALDPSSAKTAKGDFTHMISKWSRVVPFNLRGVEEAAKSSLRLCVTRLPIDAATLDVVGPVSVGLLHPAALSALKKELEKFNFRNPVVVCRDDADYWNAEVIASEIRKLGIFVSVEDYRGGYATINERLKKDRRGLEASLPPTAVQSSACSTFSRVEPKPIVHMESPSVPVFNGQENILSGAIRVLREAAEKLEALDKSGRPA